MLLEHVDLGNDNRAIASDRAPHLSAKKNGPAGVSRAGLELTEVATARKPRSGLETTEKGVRPWAAPPGERKRKPRLRPESAQLLARLLLGPAWPSQIAPEGSAGSVDCRICGEISDGHGGYRNRGLGPPAPAVRALPLSYMAQESRLGVTTGFRTQDHRDHNPRLYH